MKFWVIPIVCCLALCANAATKKVSIDQVPPGVQKAIKQELRQDKLIEIEEEDESGEKTYTVTRAHGATERFFVVNSDGILTSVEIALDETPPAVQKTIKAKVADGSLDSVEKNLEDNEISYDIDMTRKDGLERSFSVTLDGKLASEQISLGEAPEPARKTIEAHLDQGRIADVYKLYEENEVYFDAEVERDGRARDVIVTPEGKLESIQMFLSELPEGAQKTIRQNVGTGTIVRIDKSFQKRQGVETFEVEARKDGKPLNLVVGPRGRLFEKEH